jgi:leucyl aminopeptidase
LGYECGALFTNNEALSKKTTRCRRFSRERLWQLPLWDVYKQDIESDIADKSKASCGAIQQQFLEYFTKSTLHGHI